MAPDATGSEQQGRPNGSALVVFFAFLRLGLTSFGGPIAHLGCFRAAFVTRRKWLSEDAWMSRLAAGAGAAAVGVLAAALYRPVFVSAVLGPTGALIAIARLLSLLLRTPVWLVVIVVALLGAYSSAG